MQLSTFLLATLATHVVCDDTAQLPADAQGNPPANPTNSTNPNPGLDPQHNTCANDICFDSFGGYWYCCDYWYSAGWAIAMWSIFGIVMLSIFVCICIGNRRQRKQRAIVLGEPTETTEPKRRGCCPCRRRKSPAAAPPVEEAAADDVASTSEPVSYDEAAPARRRLSDVGYAAVYGIELAPADDDVLGPVEHGSIVGSDVGAPSNPLFAGRPVETV